MRRTLLATVSVLALGVGAGFFMRRRRDGARCVDEVTRMPAADPAELTRRFLLYFVLPVWLAAGVADWLCHRAAHIEETTGVKESLIHLLMLAEVSVPVIAGLLFEITSPVLGLMIASFLLHDATALWDVSYALTRRRISPIEQHVHSYLEMMPLMAIAFLAVLHWSDLMALAGLAKPPVSRAIRLKGRPLPSRYLAAVLSANAFLELLPYLEELQRTLAYAEHRNDVDVIEHRMTEGNARG
jgi:hypothetical protein